MDYSCPGSSVHGESPGRNTGVGCQFLLQYRPIASTLILHYYHLGITSSARGTLIMEKKKFLPAILWPHGALVSSIIWPPDAKNWLIGKDPDAGKDWRQEKGMTEDEMVGWLTDLMEMSLSKLWELMMDREAWYAGVHELAKS